MARNAAYQEAEKKIAEALRTRATNLNLRCAYGAKDSAKLTELPESLSQVKSLQSLDLHNNQLTALPESLSQLTKLQTLDLGQNRLTMLPEWFSQLTELQTLDLSYNHLSILPDLLSHLTRLQTLYLNNNELKTLPEWLSQLTGLEVLRLDGNHLTTLPDSLSQLSALQILDLDGNQLTTLTESLSQLTGLQTLYLNDNQLTTLPDSLSQFIGLQALYLNGNQLTELPEGLSQLTALQVLYLSHNQLTALPEGLSQLTELRELGLSQNQLTVLPESLSQLTQLQKLVLSHNQLTALPESLSQLTTLQELDLNENSLNPELAAAYEQGLDAVMAYLRAKAEDQIVLNEAKLILIGEGEVGKTSLLAALRGEEWVEKRKTTRGVEVDIKSLVLTDPDSGTEITFNGWDFGGQNIYRHTHQLFFTAPAVYLAVWNPRRGPEQCCVDEWIKMVKQRAYDETRPDERPRILVVATHGGPRDRLAHIDEQQLRDEFGDLIVGFHHVDSKEGDGIEELKAAIARTAAAIPSVGRTVPTSWKNMLDALRKRSKRNPYITFKQFQALCHRQKISNELAGTYAVILNELGHLIHYSNDADLQDTVILKPEWLSKAMSYVLEDEQVKKHNGLVQHDRLSEIWGDPARPQRERYPDELHPVFLKLMERFDLSYRVVMPEAGAQETTLIAQLVPGGRPEGWERDWPEEASAGDSERTQVCRIVDAETGRTSEVEGLLYRLIVRLHRYSLGRNNYNNSRHWKTGMILDHEYNGRAFVEEIAGDVHVTVRAAYPERFVAHLCSEIEWLVDHFWKGLDCQQCVPCHDPCKGLHEVEKLVATKRRGIPEIYCSLCKEFLEIDSLLATVVPKPPLEVALAELKSGLEGLDRGQQEIKQGVTSVSVEVRRLMSLADEQFAALMTTLTDPAKEGPRLFSFEPVKPGFFDNPTWIAQKFRLTLWCEHARLPLPLLNEDKKRGVYEIELTRDWIKKSAPFLKFLSATLSLALPIAAPAIKLAQEKTAFDAIEDQLKFGTACAESFLKGSEQVGEWLVSDDEAEMEATRNMLAEGSTLRELHAILKAKDPVNRFGGLVRVQNKQHKFFWVHEKFVSEY